MLIPGRVAACAPLFAPQPAGFKGIHSTGAHTMTIELTVPDMTCGHCVQTITQAVQAAAPGAQVQADLATHRVRVDGATQADAVRAAIREAGYELAD